MRGLALAALFAFAVVASAAGADNLGLIVRDHSLGDGQGLVVGSGLDPGVPAGTLDRRPAGEADYLITPNLGQQRGANLFHSFDRFGVGAGEVALFSEEGSAGVERVLVRVTGGERSVIQGFLRSSIAGADLYLLNPDGISFLDDGRIDARLVMGTQFTFFDEASVYLSTADALDFAAGNPGALLAFQANDVAEPFSAVECCGGAPQAFVFQGPAGDGSTGPALIEIATVPPSGNTPLSINPGQRLGVVGGTVRFDARFSVQGGELHLAAVGDAAVRVPVDLSSDSLEGEAPWLDGLGAEAVVEVRSPRARTDDALAPAGEPGRGRIVLRGGSLTIVGSQLVADGPQGIDLAASGSIELTGGQRAALLYHLGGDPDAIGIRLESRDVELTQGAQIAAVAADIAIDVGREVVLTGSSSINTGLGGSAGDISIRAGSEIRLQGNVEGLLPEIAARGGGSGDGGDVTLLAPRVTIADGAAVSTSTLGSGTAGDVEVRAETLRVSGTSLGSGVSQASAIFSETVSGGGAGGTVTVAVADQLLLEDGGRISVRTRGAGDAGSVRILGDGSAQLSGGASIGAESEGDVTGVPGDIEIDLAGDLELRGGSRLDTRCQDCEGGNVRVDLRGRLELVQSQIETDVRDGTGGNVEIGRHGGVPSIVFLDRGSITATAQRGAGGQILIKSVDFLASAGSVLDASTPGEGIDGVVDVSASEAQLDGRLDPLPASYLDVSALLRDHCAARHTAGVSSFTVQGRPAVPPSPDTLLPASLARGVASAEAKEGDQAPLGGAHGQRAQLTAFDPHCRASAILRTAER